MKKTKIFKRKINKKTNLKTLLNGIIQPNSSAIRILYKVYFKTFSRPKAIKILKKVDSKVLTPKKILIIKVKSYHKSNKILKNLSYHKKTKNSQQNKIHWGVKVKS